MGDLLDGYVSGIRRLSGPARPPWDEMVAATGMPRSPSVALYDCLQSLSAEDLAARCAARDRAFLDQGITFSFSGEERPFPLDLVPRVISAVEWSVIELGVAQRVRALEAFLNDIYGSGEILSEGVVPRKLVVTSKHFHRAAAGIRSPNGVRIQMAGIDLARGPSRTAGPWRGCFLSCSPATGCDRSTAIPPCCWNACVPAPPRVWLSPQSWCSRQGPTTRRTSSTASWLGRWESSWSTGATSSAGGTPCSCGARPGSSGSTLSTAGSTTSSWTRFSSARIRWSAVPAC